MLEKDVQGRFIDFITDKVPIPQYSTNPTRIYKELVLYRFIEVMNNAMPDFCKILGEVRLETFIFEFIQSKPRTPFVWKISSLFMNFLIEHNKVPDIPYAHDLMWFETVEVELLMGAYDKPIKETFNWTSDFKLSTSARLKILHYAVNKDEFEFVEEHPLIMYYHFDEASVYFQEVTPFMTRFLLKLEEMLPEEALLSICKDFMINEIDEVRELLEGALNEYSQLSIISVKE